MEEKNQKYKTKPKSSCTQTPSKCTQTQDKILKNHEKSVTQLSESNRSTFQKQKTQNKNNKDKQLCRNSKNSLEAVNQSQTQPQTVEIEHNLHHPKSALKIPTVFQINTLKSFNGKNYSLSGVFRLFDNTKPFQQKFIEQSIKVHLINSERYQIILGLQVREEDDDGEDLNYRSPYQDVIMNGCSVPQALEGKVKGCTELYQFLFCNKGGIEMGFSGGDNVTISYLKIRTIHNIRQPIYIPLYYPKDILSEKGPKSIGFARFKLSIPKKLWTQIVTNESIRKFFYGKAMRVQRLFRGDGKKSLTYIFNQLLDYISVLNPHVLSLSYTVSQCLHGQLSLGKVKILSICDIESLECLQFIPFASLRAVVIGNERMMNLRSLRKLQIDSQQTSPRGQGLDHSYPSIVQIRRPYLNHSETQYTFANLSYLTEAPFCTNFTSHPYQLCLKFMEQHDVLMPKYLFAKMSAGIDDSRQIDKYNSLYEQPFLYTFAASLGSIIGRELAHFGDEVM